LSLSANGQIKCIEGKPAEVSVNTTKPKKVKKEKYPKVIYIDVNARDNQPAYYLNGKLSNMTILNTIEPDLVKSIDVVKEKKEINGRSYYGQIYIKMERDYKPKLISLTDLKLKYTSLKIEPSIFVIDNVIINNNYDEYKVDEKCVLKIEVETFDNQEENLKFNIIRLMTRRSGQINKSNEIRIRGIIDETLNN